MENEKYTTLDDEEYFEKITSDGACCYRTKKYLGPVAINATPSKKLEEYLKKSVVEIIMETKEEEKND